MADCLVYWKDCIVERNQFDSDDPGPWNFHYHTRQRALFGQIKKGDNLGSWFLMLNLHLGIGY